MMEANVNIKRITPHPPWLTYQRSFPCLVEQLFFFITKLTPAQVTILALTSVLTRQRDEFPGPLLCFIDNFSQFSRGDIDFRRQCKQSFRHSFIPAFSWVCCSRSQLSSHRSLFTGRPLRKKVKHGRELRTPLFWNSSILTRIHHACVQKTKRKNGWCCVCVFLTLAACMWSHLTDQLSSPALQPLGFAGTNNNHNFAAEFVTV